MSVCYRSEKSIHIGTLTNDFQIYSLTYLPIDFYVCKQGYAKCMFIECQMIDFIFWINISKQEIYLKPCNNLK